MQGPRDLSLSKKSNQLSAGEEGKMTPVFKSNVDVLLHYLIFQSQPSVQPTMKRRSSRKQVYCIVIGLLGSQRYSFRLDKYLAQIQITVWN